MPKEYRSRTRILYDILATVQKEPDVGPTRLLFLSNLSHDRLTEYVEDLKRRGLLQEREESARKTYRTTDAGNRFLAELRRIQDVMADFGLEL